MPSGGREGQNHDTQSRLNSRFLDLARRLTEAEKATTHGAAGDPDVAPPPHTHTPHLIKQRDPEGGARAKHTAPPDLQMSGFSSQLHRGEEGHDTRSHF